MINFTQAFDLAWERTHVILFRPFNFGKWCTIGFCAFLAGFLEGGNGFNGGSYSQNLNNDNATSTFPAPDLHHLGSGFNSIAAGMTFGLIVFMVLVIVALVLAFLLLFYWLGARGQFMFLDNLVRNRGAVVGPWHYYKRQANSLFLFYVILLVASCAIIIPIVGVAILMGIPLYQEHRWPHGAEIAGFVALALVYLAAAIAIGFVAFVFREFGIPIMFRRGLLAFPAFGETLQLIKQHPGTIVIFVLLRIAIFFAVAVVSVILCCVTCCCEIIPYVGTVILLPALVYVRCFTLDCLAQFGPEYDVWTVDVAPAAAPPPFSPPPPRG